MVFYCELLRESDFFFPLSKIMTYLMLFLIIVLAYCEATFLTPYLPVCWLPIEKNH